MITNAFVKKTKLNMYQAIKDKKLNRKKFSRKRLHFETSRMKFIKKDAKIILIAKFQKKKNQCQVHKDVKNETKQDACKKRNCSKSEKISNQTKR
jgi:hypothetical protein